MVDIETTGIDPSHSHVIQIAAVRFNVEEKTIDTNEMFDQCLRMEAPNRYWDESTRQWWASQNQDVYQSIMDRSDDPRVVISNFIDFILRTQSHRPVRLWAKPTSFEWPFIQSYWRQYGHRSPLHYRNAIDLNSYITGRGHSIKEFWNTIEQVGNAHDALSDVLTQISAAMRA